MVPVVGFFFLSLSLVVVVVSVVVVVPGAGVVDVVDCESVGTVVGVEVADVDALAGAVVGAGAAGVGFASVFVTVDEVVLVFVSGLFAG